MPPHPTHDATPNTICLCPTCIDDIALFATSLTTLPQARAVTSHVLASYQSQLLQVSALTSVAEEKDPVIELLRGQVDVLSAQLREYEGYDNGRGEVTALSEGSMQNQHHHQRSPSSLTSSTSSSCSTSSSTSEGDSALTQLTHLRQQLRSERKREHPAALRLRAACNEYANQAHSREVEAQEEAQDWAWYAEGLRERVGELVGVEQWAVDCQIWREMAECEEMEWV